MYIHTDMYTQGVIYSAVTFSREHVHCKSLRCRIHCVNIGKKGQGIKISYISGSKEGRSVWDI